MKTRIVRSSALAVVLLAALFVFASQPALAADCKSLSTGVWNSAARWDCGHVPGSVGNTGDTVTIANGHTVTIDTTPLTIAGLTVGEGTSGMLTVGNSNTNRNLTVTGNVTLNSGATFNTAGDGGNILNLGGNLTNNGIFDIRIGSATANTTFNGSANQTVSGAGGTTNFNLITINNSGAANNNIVEVTSTNFTVPAGFLQTWTVGVFKVSGSYSIANTFFSAAGYTIPVAGGFWLNNANATVTAQNANATLNGSLRITAGIYNIGTTQGNDLRYGPGSSFRMDGGEVNIARNFRDDNDPNNAITFNMGGGTLTVDAVADNNSNTTAGFDIDNASSSFTMSGGTIVIQREDATTPFVDYRNIAGTVNITGGTVQFGNNSSPAGETYVIGDAGGTANVLPSLTLNQTNPPTVSLATSATVNGNVTINTGSTLDANGQNLTVTGNWTNNGTFVEGTAGTTTFNKNGTSILSLAAASGTETFCNLVISANTVLDTTDDFIAVVNTGSCITLTTDGVFKRTTPGQTINNGGGASFSDSLGNVTVIVTQTAGTDMGSTNVIVSGHVVSSTASFPCGTGFLGGQPVRRYFNITPTVTLGVAATVCLYWRDDIEETNGNDPNTVWIFHCDPATSTWTRIGTIGDYGRSGPIAGYNWVQLANVTTFSPFAIGGSPGGTTAVTLSDFDAQATSDSLTLIMLGIGLVMLCSSGWLTWKRIKN